MIKCKHKNKAIEIAMAANAEGLMWTFSREVLTWCADCGELIKKVPLRE